MLVPSGPSNKQLTNWHKSVNHTKGSAELDSCQLLFDDIKKQELPGLEQLLSSKLCSQYFTFAIFILLKLFPP